MNERIKELMIEAGYAAPEIAPRAQKLAELIIRECMTEVGKYAESTNDFSMYECSAWVYPKFVNLEDSDE